MKALVDCDIIQYSVGFASDNIHYEVEGVFNTETFDYKKDAVAYCNTNSIDESSIKKVRTPEPLEYCLHSVKKMLESIQNATGATEMQLFLTGDSNFRESLATTKIYKGNRTGDKPYWFNEIGEYLVDHWGAQYVHGIEADDAMGIEQCLENECSEKANVQMRLEGSKIETQYYTIICTIDKDLDMIPGWHYNWRKDETYWVNEDEAIRFFWKQMLTGDTVDNIQGIPGIGDKKAEKILKNIPTEELECLVGLHYAIAYDDPEEVFNEHRDLLWILREPHD